jgi:hypothetical protein
MSLWITRIGDDGGRVQYNLDNLTIGDVPCSSLSQAELFRKMRALAVPNIDATLGHQALLERWSDHLSKVVATAAG